MISENPYIGESKQGDLAGIFSYDIKYQGIAYELAYKIYEEDEKLIIILLAGTRENFYQQLKRYIK